MIPVEHPHLLVASSTHPGMRNKPNEDRYSISAYHLSSQDPTPCVLALLADGIGGHRGGEVAAELAVKSISKYIAESQVEPPGQLLQQALVYANQVIVEQSKTKPFLAGMGTTCVCAFVVGNQLFAASLGDSRLYLHRGAQIMRLTTDHSWIQEALTQGTLTPEQARGHPNAHIIRQFLGSVNTIHPDMRLRLDPQESDAEAEANQGLRLMASDRLLLCSDGLTDLVKDDEILCILRDNALDISLARLVNLANQRGGHDNITIIAMEVPQLPVHPRQENVPSEPKSLTPPKAPRSAATRWMIGLNIVAILMLVLLLIYLYSR